MAVFKFLLFVSFYRFFKLKNVTVLQTSGLFNTGTSNSVINREHGSFLLLSNPHVLAGPALRGAKPPPLRRRHEKFCG